MLPIRTTISPSIHPLALAEEEKVLGRDDPAFALGRQGLAAAREALTSVYETIALLQDATRDLEATSNRRERRNGRIVPIRERNAEFVKAADAALTRATSVVDRRVVELTRIREALAGQVAAALESPERRTPLGAEIRGHVKSISKPAERLRFVHEAIEANDKTTVASVLHSPPYLSGLTAEQVSVIRERAAERWDASGWEQLGSIDRVLERVNFGGQKLVGTYQEIIGSLRESAAGRASASTKAMAAGKQEGAS